MNITFSIKSISRAPYFVLRKCPLDLRILQFELNFPLILGYYNYNLNSPNKIGRVPCFYLIIESEHPLNTLNQRKTVRIFFC